MGNTYRCLTLALLVFASGASHGQVPLASCKNPSPVTAVAFSPDGKTLAVGNADSSMRIWDAVAHKELRQMQGSRERVTAVLYTPDGKDLIAGSENGNVTYWDTGTNKVRLSTTAGIGSATTLSPHKGRDMVIGQVHGVLLAWRKEPFKPCSSASSGP